MRLCVVANVTKHNVEPELQSLLPWLRERAEVVGVETDGDDDLFAVNADVILVLGGDGTLLSVARRLKGRQIPLMGVNFGRLGFLANFTPKELRTHLTTLLANGLPIRPRVVIEASVLPPH